MERIARIRQLADVSIRRACGFGLIAIVTVMFGVSSDPRLSIRAGAIGASLITLVLLAKAVRARRKPYKDTEVWLMLPDGHGLPETSAQRVIGGILRERYLWHATLAAVVALVLWLVGFGWYLVDWLLREDPR
ncbi:MAG: hypothetical protein AB7P50_08360 [Alphaproteobacteria bacterium]